jgi:hypothetical protein
MSTPREIDALLKRVNRITAEWGETVRKSGRSRQRGELGEFYITDSAGRVVATDVSLDLIAQELGVATGSRGGASLMTLDQAEATLYAARERLADARGFATERALRAEIVALESTVRRLRWRDGSSVKAVAA